MLPISGCPSRGTAGVHGREPHGHEGRLSKQNWKKVNEYIEFLQHEGLLTGEVENVELEDLQGVSGLKALRVQINFETPGPEKKEAKRISASM